MVQAPVQRQRVDVLGLDAQLAGSLGSLVASEQLASLPRAQDDRLVEGGVHQRGDPGSRRRQPHPEHSGTGRLVRLDRGVQLEHAPEFIPSDRGELGLAAEVGSRLVPVHRHPPTDVPVGPIDTDRHGTGRDRAGPHPTLREKRLDPALRREAGEGKRAAGEELQAGARVAGVRGPGAEHRVGDVLPVLVRMIPPPAVQTKLHERVGGLVVADRDHRRQRGRVVRDRGVVGHRLRERQQDAGVQRHDRRVRARLVRRAGPQRDLGRPRLRAALVLEQRRDPGIFDLGRVRLLPRELDIDVEVLQRLRQVHDHRQRPCDLVRRERLPGERCFHVDACAERPRLDRGLAPEAELAGELRRSRRQRRAPADPGLERDPGRPELPAVAPAHAQAGVDALGIEHQPGVRVEQRKVVGADACALRRVLADPEVPRVAAVEVEEGLGAGGDLEDAGQAPGGVDPSCSVPRARRGPRAG